MSSLKQLGLQDQESTGPRNPKVFSPLNDFAWSTSNLVVAVTVSLMFKFLADGIWLSTDRMTAGTQNGVYHGWHRITPPMIYENFDIDVSHAPPAHCGSLWNSSGREVTY